MNTIYCYNVPMRAGFKYSLNIKDYPENAAKNFSMTRLITFTVVSIVLTIMLLVSIIQNGYQGKALVFTGLAFLCILGYSILNILALIIKTKNK